MPGHYLKQFHPAYASKEQIDRQVQAAGFKTWTQLFAAKNAPPKNLERPRMAAWVPVTRVSDLVFTLRRNPDYIGVDPAGNQLPYVDEVRFTYFVDVEALNLAAIVGDFDTQERHIQITNYPVLKDQERNGKYRVITWPTFGSSDAVIQLNQSYTGDPFGSLNPRMTLLDNVGEPLLVNGMRSRRERVERVAELLRLVGLRAEFMHRFPHAFNGGQRQRIGIARGSRPAPACRLRS